MNEKEWVEYMSGNINLESVVNSKYLSVRTRLRLAYVHEILSYDDPSETASIV